MKQQHIRRKNNSEVLTSNILTPHDNELKDSIKHFNNKINEDSKDIFLESFSDIVKSTKNQIVDTLNLNLEETSVLDANNNYNNFYLKNSNKTGNNKTVIKIITSKFHDLYLKLINQIKFLKQENNILKKKTSSRTSNEASSNNTKQQTGINLDSPDYDIILDNKNNLVESENESLKYLLHEEMECFNGILFDFNIQFNELQSQEETLRRDILKKHKEIEKLNLDIDDCKKQKENYVKDLQNIALKLNEYRVNVPSQILQGNNNNNSNNKSGINFHPSDRDDLNDIDENENDQSNTSMIENDINEKSRTSYKEEEYLDDGDNYEADDYHLLLNSDNKEYLIKKLVQENKKYKSVLKVMKSEEAEFNNILLQLESEIDNFSKFKNYSLTKINTIEESIVKCRERMDDFTTKINKVEFQLEITDENI